MLLYHQDIGCLQHHRWGTNTDTDANTPYYLLVLCYCTTKTLGVFNITGRLSLKLIHSPIIIPTRPIIIPTHLQSSLSSITYGLTLRSSLPSFPLFILSHSNRRHCWIREREQRKGPRATQGDAPTDTHTLIVLLTVLLTVLSTFHSDVYPPFFSAHCTPSPWYHIFCLLCSFLVYP